MAYTINIENDKAFLSAMTIRPENAAHETRWNSGEQAFSYLSLWGVTNQHIVSVNIFANDQLELVAIYRDANDAHVFTLAAIYNPDSKLFSFHS